MNLLSNRVRSYITRLALASCFAILSPAAMAGGFQVTPTIGEIASGGKIATFKLNNSGAEPVSVQADAFAWSQDAGGDKLVPAADLVISPRIVTLAPGQEMLVRIALRAPAGDTRAYRLKLRELPPPATSELNGVRTLIEHNIPLFFLAEGAKPAMTWRATTGKDGQLRLEGTNAGTRHFRATAVTVTDDHGGVLVDQKGPRYALPHATVRWALRTAKPVARGQRIRARLAGSDGSQDLALVVE